jgi:hypothetical protein
VAAPIPLTAQGEPAVAGLGAAAGRAAAGGSDFADLMRRVKAAGLLQRRLGRTDRPAPRQLQTRRRHLHRPRRRRPARSRWPSRARVTEDPDRRARHPATAIPHRTAARPPRPATTTITSSPAAMAACIAAPASTAATGGRPPTETPTTASPPSSGNCTSTTCATATRPGSSKTGYQRSPGPNGSGTGYPACEVSTATSAPPSNKASPRGYRREQTAPPTPPPQGDNLLQLGSAYPGSRTIG